MIDTSVIVAALRSGRGASAEVLRLALKGEIEAVYHYKLVAEYREVVGRFAGAGELLVDWERAERLIAALVGAGEAVDVRYLWRPNLRDEGDNFVYEIAFAASPASIVTHNLRDFRNPELRWPGVLAKSPAEVLTERRLGDA